jgi:hypothetical protein
VPKWSIWRRNCSISCSPGVGEPKQIFALEEAAAAHHALESRSASGATVLTHKENIEEEDAHGS